jgi:2-dehydro-3-deoxyphosphogluconate aldolase/(4S)-4-hydroxy-2-oxoglutarate aldolase
MCAIISSMHFERQNQMSNFLEILETTRLITIIRGIPNEKALSAADALFCGGVRLAEFTFDFSGNTPDEETAEIISSVVKHTAGRMIIGAGTVTTEKQLKLAYEAGAEFIISPDVNETIIRHTKELGLFSVPGALTPTEISSALRFGADCVKIFPSSAFGPSYFKQVTAPFNGARLLAVTGITLEDVKQYIDNGCFGFGIGGAITGTDWNPEIIKQNAALWSAACKK